MPITTATASPAVPETAWPIGRWTAIIRRWRRRARQRRALAALDDRLLADIGVSRDQARAEAAKPFWR